MTPDGFAFRLAELVGEAEDAGLELPAMIAVLAEHTGALEVSEPVRESWVWTQGVASLRVSRRMAAR